jgi:hypothetical protein
VANRHGIRHPRENFNHYGQDSKGGGFMYLLYPDGHPGAAVPVPCRLPQRATSVFVFE